MPPRDVRRSIFAATRQEDSLVETLVRDHRPGALPGCERRSTHRARRPSRDRHSNRREAREAG